MPYRVKTGHDQSLESLVNISPQPRSGGVRYTRRTYGGDGTVYTVGAYVELEFDLLGSATQYQALLKQFGLDESLTAAVTLYARDDTFAWKRYNGLAIRPETGRDVTWDRYFPRRITILVRNLEVITS